MSDETKRSFGEISREEMTRTGWRLLSLPAYIAVGCLTIFVMFVGCVGILFAVGDEAQKRRTTPPASTAPTSPGSPAVNFGTPAPSGSPQVFAKGDLFRIDDMAIRIDAIRLMREIPRATMGGRAAAGSQFAIVTANLMNEGKGAKSLFADSFKLVDSQERVFDISNDMIILPNQANTLTMIERFQPSVPWLGYLIFIVPDTIGESEPLYLYIDIGDGGFVKLQ